VAGFVRVDGPTEDIKRISRALKDAPRDVKRELPRALMASAKPVKEAAKSKAASMPLPRAGGFEATYRSAMVRAIVSKATSLSRNPAVRVGVISKSKSAGKARGVGRKINNTGRIRHPVFGDRTMWADTDVSEDKGWFDDAVTEASPRTEAELKRRVDDLMERIVFGRTTI
jgi:hypothetical protein